MDVVESGTAYVVTVELPGVNVDGIRVEIDHGRYL
jgi:HSP20 family molecular chaperone IbpA